MECKDEIDAKIAVVTETWLQDGASLEEDKRDLSLGAGLGMLCRNRAPCQANRVSYGGVAVHWKESFGAFREVQLQNEDRHEVLASIGTIRGHSRRLAVLACYVPPNLEKKRADKCQEFIADSVLHIKNNYRDPYIVVTGDFNQWPVEDYLNNFTDIKEIDVGATRGSKSIDRVFSNLSRSVTVSGTLAPLGGGGTGGGKQEVGSSIRILYSEA